MTKFVINKQTFVSSIWVLDITDTKREEIIRLPSQKMNKPLVGGKPLQNWSHMSWLFVSLLKTIQDKQNLISLKILPVTLSIHVPSLWIDAHNDVCVLQNQKQKPIENNNLKINRIISQQLYLRNDLVSKETAVRRNRELLLVKVILFATISQTNLHKCETQIQYIFPHLSVDFVFK